jgi:hypothetical protein
MEKDASCKEGEGREMGETYGIDIYSKVDNMTKTLISISQKHFNTHNKDKNILYKEYHKMGNERAKQLNDSFTRWHTEHDFLQPIEATCESPLKNTTSQRAAFLLENTIRTFIEKENCKVDNPHREQLQTNADLYSIPLGFMKNIDTWLNEAITALKWLIQRYTKLYKKKYDITPQPADILANIQHLLLELGSINGGMFGYIMGYIRGWSMDGTVDKCLTIDENDILHFSQDFLDVIDQSIYAAHSFNKGNTSTVGCPFLAAKSFAQNVFALLLKYL